MKTNDDGKGNQWKNVNTTTSSIIRTSLLSRHSGYWWPKIYFFLRLFVWLLLCFNRFFSVLHFQIHWFITRKNSDTFILYDLIIHGISCVINDRSKFNHPEGMFFQGSKYTCLANKWKKKCFSTRKIKIESELITSTFFSKWPPNHILLLLIIQYKNNNNCNQHALYMHLK